MWHICFIQIHTQKLSARNSIKHYSLKFITVFWARDNAIASEEDFYEIPDVTGYWLLVLAHYKSLYNENRVNTVLNRTCTVRAEED